LVVSALESAFSAFQKVSAPQRYDFFEYTGPKVGHPTHLLIIHGTASLAVEEEIVASAGANTAVLRVRVYRPWSAAHLLKAIPASITHIAVVNVSQAEQGSSSAAAPLGFGQLFLDVAGSFHSGHWDASRPIPAIREARVKLHHGQTLDREAIIKVVEAFHTLNEHATASHFDVALENNVANGHVVCRY
jgi:pyruvate-ferredoxin/flavodoxin oxidoreductase